MHVRKLELQGFKTFAARTSFELGRGITAIIGPNGSGKSNLADALRWVLGEQSYSTLRSRRTEDVIFSGSSARAPLGMAEVSLLLDNEDGYLPIDFPEVEITRRAHRSGVNEYYLNRRRVRLQDIEEILGGLTSSYVVIHQGLVDEALSLRPGERRLLLEEAAEVRRYHVRRRRAQERLERTQANMTRISDLRNELSPRLRMLKKQSQQARQRADMDAALHEALRAWYRLLSDNASAAYRESLEKERESQARLSQAREALEEATAEADRVRQEFQRAQRQQEEYRQRESDLRWREAELRQQLAQIEGEQRAMERYQRELCGEIARWQEEAARQEERFHAVQETTLSLRQRLEAAQVALGRQEESFQETEGSLHQLQQDGHALQERISGVTARMQEIERQLAYLSSREEALNQEEGERSGLLQGLLQRRDHLLGEKAQTEADLTLEEAGWSELLAGLENARTTVSEDQETLRKMGEELERHRWQLAEKRARLAALADAGARDDGAAFLQDWALRKGKPPFPTPLSGVRVPPDLEVALEAALGAEAVPLQTDTWEEARAALEALAGAGAGRATLLPGDDLRPPAGPPAGIETTGSEGYLLDHLGFDEEDRPALCCLLGRVLLASNLEAARLVARRLPPGWIVVTRQGEVATAEGVLRGGRRPLEKSGLARERERQALSKALAELEASCQEQEERQAQARRRLEEHQEALSALTQLAESKRGRREALSRRVQELEGELTRIEEAEHHSRRLQLLQEERKQAALERDRAESERIALEAEQAALRTMWEQAQEAERASQAHFSSARDLLQETRTAWAVVGKEWEHQQALEEMARHSLERLRQQIAEGDQRRREAEAQRTAWDERMTALRAELEQVAATIASSPATQSPTALPITFEELARRDEELSRLRQELLEAQEVASHAAVDAQRQQDRLKELLRRGLEEVGPEASAYGPASEALLNALLEDPPEWVRAPLDAAPPLEELERRIAHLREEARRIGPVNPLAEEEYRQTSERYEFLGQQLQDMQDAIRSLQQIIAELDQAMEKHFRETFQEINREFGAYFTRLFGGGTASLRLVRIGEEDGGLSDLGVEIVARPPGKRAHSLALLSGGERALASTALLFAILKVNPRPFCLLDEVDAMLDEANVGRFRECLEELTDQTQFIVITHNRTTIEAASTLYGVSLADDGSSRVLSLRLEEVAT